MIQLLKRHVKKKSLFYLNYFSFRFVASSNKGTDLASNGNVVRQSQIVAQQLFTLKTTINHLKNAYNGNDVEWPDSSDGKRNFKKQF